MDMISRSFRLERGSSLNNRLGRSNSSLLASELSASRITAYERLSESMRLTGDDSSGYRRRRNRAWAFVTKVFSFRNIGGSDVIGRRAAEDTSKPRQEAAAEEKKKRRRTSWVPKRHRRWPVQGW